LLEAKRHSLVVQLPSERLELNVDPLRMSQALSNLLTNAAKYTDAGGHIVVSARRESVGVSISVQDDGIGMTGTAIPRIFEMFSQIEGAQERSQGGLGIGLALVKGLVALHGGTVEAHSEGLGQGSTFTIRLPNACLSQVLLNRPTGDARDEPVVTAKCRILVADDNQDAAQALALILRLSGHEVLLAHSGKEAIELAEAHKPEIFVLDIGMPGGNGYEVARWLRTQSHSQKALLIALTGWGQQEDINRALNAGFDQHFTKPVDPTCIEKQVAEFCSRSTSERGRARGLS
jgi:CheY-like chemotaxis protein